MTVSASSSPRLEPITSNKEKVYTSIGRGGGGNIFQTEEKASPRLVPVSSGGPQVPADQKKFSISRGGYGNIKDNSPDTKAKSPRLAPESEEELVQNLQPLDSVRSIGRGGFGNQIRHIHSRENTPRSQSKERVNTINSNNKGKQTNSTTSGKSSVVGKLKKIFR